MRVVRFYDSCPAASSSAGPQLQTLDRSVPRRTGTASPGSECSPPDLNCRFRSQCSLRNPKQRPRIRVFLTGPQLQALDRSVPRRTRTASSGSECSRPLPAGPEQQPLDQSDSRRTSTESCRSQCSTPDPNSNLWIKVIPVGPQPRAPDQSVPRQISTASSGSERSLPDLNHKEQKECQNICQKVCQNRCQVECQ